MHKNQGWVGVGLLVIGLAGGWWLARGADTVSAQAQRTQAPAATASNPQLLTLLSGGETSPRLLYIIDPVDRVLCVYDFDARKNKLRLAAVRHFAADMMLAEFQNEAPTVKEIEELTGRR